MLETAEFSTTCFQTLKDQTGNYVPHFQATIDSLQQEAHRHLRTNTVNRVLDDSAPEATKHHKVH